MSLVTTVILRRDVNTRFFRRGDVLGSFDAKVADVMALLSLVLSGLPYLTRLLFLRLLHYKLYLVCKVRRKMDMEHITPEMLRDEQFKDFAATEKDSVDRVRLAKPKRFDISILTLHTIG